MAEKAEARAEKGEVAAPGAIMIGKKPALNYALAMLIQFNEGASEVKVKARGSAISKAVDVVEIVKRRFLAEAIEVKDVKIGTDVVGEAENARHVSTIEIVVAKKS